VAKGTNKSSSYPFCLPYPLEQTPEALGEASQWFAEWSWYGMRSQLIRREGKTFIWSDGEELVSERFPELLEAAELLPDGTVMDGVILGWDEGEVLPFEVLQERLKRKTFPEISLQEFPVALMAFDILESEGIDIRDQPLSQRKRALIQLLSPGSLDAAPSCRGQLHPRLRVSTNLQFSSWDELAELRAISRDLKAEGILIKRADSAYGEGLRKGDWWKWQ
jgi:DNA ligase-1